MKSSLKKKKKRVTGVVNYFQRENRPVSPPCLTYNLSVAEISQGPRLYSQVHKHCRDPLCGSYHSNIHSGKWSFGQQDSVFQMLFLGKVIGSICGKILGQ